MICFMMAADDVFHDGPAPSPKPAGDADRPLRLFQTRHGSPIGALVALTDDEGVLRALEFEDHVPRMHQLLSRQYPAWVIETGRAAPQLGQRLAAYFDGDIHVLADIPVATGGTPFQRAVWSALRQIAAGTTLSYGALARKLDCPKASRAVGLANGANPVSLVVPCHRVIGANGSLTGFGGGLHRKRWLLAHEARACGAGNLELALQ